MDKTPYGSERRLISNSRQISPFPWAALEVLRRADLHALREVRALVSRAVRTENLARAASELLEIDVQLELRSLRAGPARLLQEPTLRFETADGSCSLELELEPELITATLSRLLDRHVPLASANAKLDPALAGAAAALIVEIVRRTHGELPLLAVAAASASETLRVGSALSVEATVTLAGKPYAARAWLRTSSAPTRSAPPASLAALGSLPISVPLVAGLSLTTRDELATLDAGDAWLPGAGWLIRGGANGRVVLAAPLAEQGIAAEFDEAGGLVLQRTHVSLALDVEQAMANSDAESQLLGQTVMDTPIVVRIELGTVTLSAREWAELRPGDVISSGRRLAEPVVLRIAGRELARGELVNVEGELGVRIRELYTEEVAELPIVSAAPAGPTPPRA